MYGGHAFRGYVSGRLEPWPTGYRDGFVLQAVEAFHFRALRPSSLEAFSTAFDPIDSRSAFGPEIMEESPLSRLYGVLHFEKYRLIFCLRLSRRPMSSFTKLQAP